MDSEEKYQKGLALAYEGNPEFDLEKSVELLREVLKEDSRHKLARHFLADGLRRLGLHEAGLQVMMEGHEKESDTFQKIQIAACLYNLGRYEEGLSWLEHEDLNPAAFSILGLNVRARLCMALGLTDRAHADQLAMNEYESAQPSVWDEAD